MAKIIQIEGLGYQAAETLQRIGIQSIEQLLDAGSTPEDRQKLSEQTGLDTKHIYQWVCRADLVRIKGIGNEYADLLDAAGIPTVPILAQQSPEYIHQQLTRVNRMKRLVKRIPAVSRITIWIEYAKQLPSVVIA